MRQGGALIVAVWVATLIGAFGTLLIVMSSLDLAPLFTLLATDMVAFSTMGLVIERRRPGNRIARVLVAAGAMLVLAFSGFVIGATRYATHGVDDVIGGFFAMVGGSTLGLALFVAVPMLALLFPDERLPGPRWRIPVGLTLGALVASAVLFAVQPGPANTDLAESPLAIDNELVVALGRLALPLETFGIMAGAVLAVAAVATRFRRSTGLERQQVKWLLWAVVVIGLTLPASMVDGNGDNGFTILDAVAISSLSLLPISVGIAITRYRLYEIDRIVSRTIGWLLVTGVLAAVFAGVVVGLQAALAPVTSNNTLAVAASTLVAAALFQPLRGRIQRAVDRRFNRSRISADDTVAAFAVHVRSEIDLAALRSTLVSTARDAVHPTG
ncbi:MAG TPA: hypothetical protein VFW02_00265, partial [Candidatus Limnocylindrales bacterium]|nr:hypothetical protein [Candidatus Limnocylindrales bacterium]